MNDFDPGHIHLKQQFEKNMKINFASSPINSSKKKEKKAISQWRLKHLRSEPPPRSQHPATFSGHKPCEGENIIFKNYYVT